MKKILVLLAAAMLVFACGGSSDKKGDDKKSNNTEQNDSKSDKKVKKSGKKSMTVEEMAMDYTYRMLDAMESGDESLLMAIQSEANRWYNSLSSREQEQADAVSEEAYEMYYNGGDDYDDYDYEDYDEYDYDDYDDYDYDYDDEW